MRKLLKSKKETKSVNYRQLREDKMSPPPFVSAACHYVPPLLIYPRKRLPPAFFDGTPPSTYDIAHLSGWM